MSAAAHQAETVLAKARDLLPAIAEREAATEAARDVPQATIDAIRQAGLHRLLQPRKFGGMQAPFGLFSQVVETLAEACSATGWVYAVLGEHQWIIACYPEQAQIDVWGETPDALASSSLAPRETARRVHGGWVLSGRFPFSSGSSHAQWAIIGARCEDAAGAAPTRYLLVPMRDIEIVDDWHVLGLRGTGSRTLHLRDVFVPEHRSVLLRDLLDGTPPGIAEHPDFPLLRAPRGALVPFSLPPVVFALGRRALAVATAALTGRVSRGVTRTAESELVQVRLAEASAAIETACLILSVRRDESDAALRAGGAISMEQAARNRRDVGFAVRQIRDAVQDLAELCGARMVYDSDRLQPLLRDVLTIATHHVFHPSVTMVPYGRMLLGLPPGAGEA